MIEKILSKLSSVFSSESQVDWEKFDQSFEELDNFFNQPSLNKNIVQGPNNSWVMYKKESYE